VLLEAGRDAEAAPWAHHARQPHDRTRTVVKVRTPRPVARTAAGACDRRLVQSTIRRLWPLLPNCLSQRAVFTSILVRQVIIEQGYIGCARAGASNSPSIPPTSALPPPPLASGLRARALITPLSPADAIDNGQPVLLPPGIHVWRSESLFFQQQVALNDHLITLGPYTLVTVDEGYAAVTQDNGKQRVLKGGHTHLLSHKNWKFEKVRGLGPRALALKYALKQPR